MIKKKLAGAVLAVAAAGLFALAPAVSTAMDDDSGKPMHQGQNGCGNKHKHKGHHKKHGCHQKHGCNQKHRDDNKRNSDQKMAPGDDKAADSGNR